MRVTALYYKFLIKFWDKFFSKASFIFSDRLLIRRESISKIFQMIGVGILNERNLYKIGFCLVT
ncbi:hypothetical protein LEP1GSC165_1214 [Leptospira santarosai str. CBC523]|nr:hypothetical protein LEP1GSC165_1214 [Leptospira santarosai str. CBC523]